MMTDILDTISEPDDLKRLPAHSLPALAEKIRHLIIETVSRNGGHLASNLGVVELTIALHRVYDFRHDRLVWDVGHQCYAHKILTGRRPRFHTLRLTGGLSGFPNPAESAYDPFIVGHASTSISSALGLATAFRMRGEPHKVVAVVGDASISGGMCFEALNHAGHVKEDILVILNDNEMAIARTVGGLARYLTDIRTRPATHRLREDLHRFFQQVPVIGASLEWAQEKILDAIKGLVDAGHLFYALGFRYYGPLDGHDIAGLEKALWHLRNVPGPKLLHVATRKGDGFAPAAADPECYHSAAPFEVRGAAVISTHTQTGKTYTDTFVEQLLKHAEMDKSIVAITAAMPAGTGIKSFGLRFPDRFIDVGICEAHCITFAAALARGGLKPVVAIYSTFLQRGYDQLIHDLAVQGDLPILLAIDRAGLVGQDGITHHGIFDIAFLRHVPGIVLMAPRDGEELRAMVDFALAMAGPTAIRYPRGNAPAFPEAVNKDRPPLALGKAETLRRGKDGAVLAYGRMVWTSWLAAEDLAKEGIDLAVVNMRFAKPLDREAIAEAARTGLVITVEDHILAGGLGSAVAETMADGGLIARLRRIGIPDRFVGHGLPEDLDRELGLDVAGLSQAFRAAVRGQEKRGVAASDHTAPVTA